jgi:Tfp pilus assembly pilus retraction ATPase PilT
MKLHELLAFAKKSRATELRLEVGKSIELFVAGNAKLLNLPGLDASGFEELVLENLGAATRETLRTTGRCEEWIAVEGLKVRVLVEEGKARVILPVVTAPESEPSPPSFIGTRPGRGTDVLGAPARPVRSKKVRGTPP